MDRQEAINELYRAYSDAGDDDMNARERIKDYVDELLAAAVDATTDFSKWDLQAWLKSGRQVTDAELDVAEAAYEDETK